MRRLACLPIALAFAAPPALAQEGGAEALPSDAAMAGALLSARRSYTRADRPRCGEKGAGGDIVVCAPDDGAQWRVPSTADSDPTSRAALRDGVPRAPQLDRGSCRGQPGCITGGWAPPPIYIIDLAAIPETPKDSDADKVARGEMSDR